MAVVRSTYAFHQRPFSVSHVPLVIFPVSSIYRWSLAGEATRVLISATVSSKGAPPEL